MPDLKSPPQLVMVTAFAREELLRQAESSGFKNVLIKPVTASLLFETAVGVLGGDSEKSEKADMQRPHQSDRARGARVLLVEDNEINQEVASGQLADAGVDVDLAANGAIAVQMVRENRYDAVLMDMQMPVMDGLEATRIIRSEPRFAALPIIAITANAMASDRAECLAAGMNDHIAKPIDPDRLFSVLVRWIGDGSAAGAAWSSGRPAPPGETDSLGITGVDVRAGLRRTGGDRSRYLSLLRKLAQQQRGAAQQIRAALNAGDRNAAELIADSLKGAASTLGADPLSMAAAEVEKSIRSEAGLEEAMQNFSSALDAAVAAISSLPKDVEAVDGNGASREECVATLDRLKRLLEADDGEAAEFIRDAERGLRSLLTPDEMKTLSDHVTDYDFAAAMNCLASIASRHSLNLEGRG